MTQYISKDVLVAEIEKLRKYFWESFQKGNSTEDQYCLRDGVIQDIFSLLDTLEVKEVDPVKEYNNFIIDSALTGLVNRNAGIVIAKHFYELGLKTQKGEDI